MFPVTDIPAAAPTAVAPATTVPATSRVAPPPEAAAPAAGKAHPGAVSACRPKGLVIPEHAVDAPVVEVGLDDRGNLGTPEAADRDKAGWYPSVLAGSPRGTVILDSHTYVDGSAIFKTDFDRRVRAPWCST